MNRYVKIKFQDKIWPSWFHYVDENYKWSDASIVSENKKAIEYAKMAFLDHGEFIGPENDISSIKNIKAVYLTTTKDTVFLIGEGGNFMTWVEGMEIVAQMYNEFYPIKQDSAIVCENDPFDKWHGGLDHVFSNVASNYGTDSFHYMFNFRSRTEEEIIEAFKNTPVIISWSSYKEADWWELMIRCIIKSKTQAKIVAIKPTDKLRIERYNKCIEFANKFNVKINA